MVVVVVVVVVVDLVVVEGEVVGVLIVGAAGDATGEPGPVNIHK